MDNNSTDSTLILLKKFELVDQRIKVISEIKPGACAARNAGLKLATSKYIQFLDADDLLISEKLGHQMKFINDTMDGIDFIAGACIRRKISGPELMDVPIDDHWKGLFVNQLGNTCSNLWNKAAIGGDGHYVREGVEVAGIGARR